MIILFIYNGRHRTGYLVAGIATKMGGCSLQRTIFIYCQLEALKCFWAGWRTRSATPAIRPYAQRLPASLRCCRSFSTCVQVALPRILLQSTPKNKYSSRRTSPKKTLPSIVYICIFTDYSLSPSHFVRVIYSIFSHIFYYFDRK